MLARAARVLPGLWLGFLLCVVGLATPAPFALLARADAGRVVGRMLAQEAYTSLLLGAVLLVLARLAARRDAASGPGSQVSADMMLAMGTLFCTVAGYFALQPAMAAARLGQGAFSFGQLHAISAGFYAVKVVLVAALAWRVSAGQRPSLPPSS